MAPSVQLAYKNPTAINLPKSDLPPLLQSWQKLDGTVQEVALNISGQGMI